MKAAQPSGRGAWLGAQGQLRRRRLSADWELGSFSTSHSRDCGAWGSRYAYASDWASRQSQLHTPLPSRPGFCFFLASAPTFGCARADPLGWGAPC